MVSTKTIICRSNLIIAIQDIYEHLNLGKRDYLGDNFQIDMIYFQNHIKHVASIIPKNRKQSFRNSLNIVVGMDGKKINFKVSKNGKFQFTGCRSEGHAVDCIKNFMEICRRECSNDITALDRDAVFEFQTVMTNIDFDIGFPVNRQKLDEIMNKETNYRSLFETSFGYTGVNIKFPVSIDTLKIPQYSASFCFEEGISTWKTSVLKIPFASFLKKKGKYNTFLVFHSGKVIMSGMIAESMTEDLNVFLNIVRGWKSRVEERAS